MLCSSSLGLVFGYIELTQVLGRCHLVCRHWRRTLAHAKRIFLASPASVQHVDLLRRAVHAPQVEEVDLADSVVDPLVFATFSNIVVLRLHETFWPCNPASREICLDSIAIAWPNIRGLCLAGCMSFPRQELAFLCLALSRLETLDLSATAVSAAALVHLRHLGLIKLDLSELLTQLPKLGDDGLRHLPCLRSLRELRLSQCTRITNAGLQHVSELKSLETLDLTSVYKLTDDGLAHLACLANLTWLDLSRCARIRGTGLFHLVGSQRLETLKMTFCAELALLPALPPRLQELDVRGSLQLTDGALSELPPSLQSLGLRGCTRFTDRAVETIAARCPVLRKLDLRGNSLVTDRGVRLLPECVHVSALGVKAPNCHL